MVDLLKELWMFLSERKKWWMFPIVAVMLLMGGLLILSQGSAFAPFLYTVF